MNDQHMPELVEQKVRALTKPLRRRLAAQESTLAVVRVDLEVISHQLRSLEHRLEAVAADVRDGPVTGSPSDVAEARNVLDQVRSEHERIRVRLQMLTVFEERFRRIEEAVVTMYGGDLRGPRSDTTP